MKFYKYKSISTIERDFPSLENNVIWFSKVESLNDPYEGTFVLNETEKFALDFLLPNKKNELNNFYEKSKKVADAQNNLAGVLSLTITKENLLMWSHYAENHKGYILEFEFSEDSFEAIGEIAKYRPEISLIKLQYTSKPIRQNIFPKNKLIQLCNKSKCWEYEKEFRFISSHYGNFKYDKSCLKAVYLGANISIENLNKFKSFCALHNISLFKARLSIDAFDMKFDKIV